MTRHAHANINRGLSVLLLIRAESSSEEQSIG